MFRRRVRRLTHPKTVVPLPEIIHADDGGFPPPRPPSTHSSLSSGFGKSVESDSQSMYEELLTAIRDSFKIMNSSFVAADQSAANAESIILKLKSFASDEKLLQRNTGRKNCLANLNPSSEKRKRIIEMMDEDRETCNHVVELVPKLKRPRLAVDFERKSVEVQDIFDSVLKCIPVVEVLVPDGTTLEPLTLAEYQRQVEAASKYFSKEVPTASKLVDKFKSLFVSYPVPHANVNRHLRSLIVAHQNFRKELGKLKSTWGIDLQTVELVANMRQTSVTIAMHGKAEQLVGEVKKVKNHLDQCTSAAYNIFRRLETLYRLTRYSPLEIIGRQATN